MFVRSVRVLQNARPGVRPLSPAGSIRRRRLSAVSQKGKPAERLGFDARGIPRWDQRTRTGEYVPKPSDSLVTRALKADDITLADTRRNRILPNPYGTQTSEKSLKSPQQPRLHARAE